MTPEAALQLLRTYITDEGRIAHSIGVSDFAFTTATTIHAKHPDLPIDPEKVRIAALLHDIGRGLPGDHEANSVTILNREGLHEYAAIVMHGSYYEIMKLRGTLDPTLIPATLENKIVAYADARFKDRVVSLTERWADIEVRRSNESEKIASLRSAKKRFLQMEQELLELCT